MKNILSLSVLMFLLANIHAQKTGNTEYESQNPLNNSKGAERK